MSELVKITRLEAKLFFREFATWFVALVLPTFILLVMGAILAPHKPDKFFGGLRFIDVFVPSLVVVTLATLGVNTLPIRLVTYREKGVLRRLSTTPVQPTKLLTAQLLINMVVAVAAVLLLIIVGRLAFQIPIPRHPVGFCVTFLLGMSSLSALGLLVAAVAPTARSGALLALPLYFVVMFLGGVYLPRFLLPEFLVRIGDYTPPGVHALFDAWRGIAPDPLQLATMAVITVVAGAAAARLFRWE
jgi:ABC-2 type transport system permease protein